MCGCRAKVKTIEGSNHIGLGTNRNLGHYVSMMQCNIGKEHDASIDGDAADGDAAFDAWLSESLSAAYNAAICDPVPEEMLAILMAVSEARPA